LQNFVFPVPLPKVSYVEGRFVKFLRSNLYAIAHLLSGLPLSPNILSNSAIGDLGFWMPGNAFLNHDFVLGNFEEVRMRLSIGQDAGSWIKKPGQLVEYLAVDSSFPQQLCNRHTGIFFA